MRVLNFLILTSFISLIQSSHCEAGGWSSKEAAPEDTKKTTSRNGPPPETFDSDVGKKPKGTELILYKEFKFNGLSVVYPKSAEFNVAEKSVIASVENVFSLYYFKASEPDELDNRFQSQSKIPSSAESLDSCVKTIFKDMDALGVIRGKETEVDEAKNTIYKLIDQYNIRELASKNVKLQRNGTTKASLLRIELNPDTIVILSVFAYPELH